MTLPARIRNGLRSIRRQPAGFVVPVFAGIAGVVGSFAIAAGSPGFVAAPIAGFLARRLPAEIITAAILYLGSLGQALNLITAVGISIVLFAITTAVGLRIGRRTDRAEVGILVVGGLAAALSIILTGDPVPALGAGVATGAIVVIDHLVRGVPVTAATASTSADRRRLLAGLATLASIGVLGTLYRQVDADGVTPATGGSGGSTGSGAGTTSTPTGDGSVSPIQQLMDEARQKSLDVPGMEPLISEDFYQVDINAVDPELQADGWTLSVTGAVEEELTLTYDDLTSRPAEHRFNTLRCVGENLNGHKMDTALWTGTPIADLIEAAGPNGGCECVMLRAEDGYFEEFPLSALRNGFLAWGMNGGTLPRGHGHPVRALIPGHWGEINVKWLTEIEILDKKADGYWEKRGWHGTGPVNTVAKLHAVNQLDDGRIQLGGHTYAGTRGIEQVEVSIDGGDSWSEATLSEPLPGDDVWRQWVYEYDAPAETHTAVVRATDGEGMLQPEEQSNAFPSGPTGWVSKRINPA